ncbi:MAG: sugar ABC transporter permease [Clostridia bacterium]|nr:sugar ABC transporter permease [Clostridia bacterium]
MVEVQKNKRASLAGQNRKKLAFYVIGLIPFLIQFLIFYVYVHLDAFVLAFQRYEAFGPNAGKFVWNGLENFKAVFNDFSTHAYLREGIWRGFLIYLFGLVQLPLHIFVAWYAVKKKPLITFAHIALYIPGLMSGAVYASIAKFTFAEGIPAVVEKLTGNAIPSLIDSGDHMVTFWTILINNFVLGITGNMLIYAGPMNSISESIIEAAELDGITPIKEFVYIYLPLISPTVMIFFVMGLSGIFTADIGLFAYYGENAPTNLYTLGYYMTLLTKRATNDTYAYLSALGMLICMVTIPITLLGRWLGNKLTGRFN